MEFTTSTSTQGEETFKILNCKLKNRTVRSNNLVADTNYSDPVGPLPIRPMTAAGKRDDDFGDEELGEDLLPE